MHAHSKRTLLLLGLLAVGACGGGGGGGVPGPGPGPGPDPDPDPVQNTQPAANAGEDQQVHERTQVTLDARSSSDADGDTLTYKWEQTAGPAVVLSDTTIRQPSFDIPLLQPTDLSEDGSAHYTFKLTVNDGKATHSDSVTVVAKPVGMVVYDSDREKAGTYEVYIADEFGNEHKLSMTSHENGTQVSSITVSPDRRWVAWRGDHRTDNKLEAWIAPTDGSAQARRVTTDLTSVDHNADGRPDGEVTDLQWSSTNLLAFTANIDTADDEDHFEVFQLYVYDPVADTVVKAGSAYQDILNNGGFTWSSNPAGDGCWDSDDDCGTAPDLPTADIFEHFAWSPDGQCLAYQTTKVLDVREAFVTCDLGVTTQRISNIFKDEDGAAGWDLDIGGVNNLPDVDVSDEFVDRAWSPNSQWVAYRANEDRAHIADLDLYITRRDGSETRRITERTTTAGTHTVRNFAFSPDGKYIAAISNPAVSTRNDLRTIQISDGTVFGLSRISTWPTPVSGTQSVYPWHLQWSPDSTHVLFEGEDYIHANVHQLLVNVANADADDTPKVVFNRYRDVYDNDVWDGPLYAEAEGGDGRWDTDGATFANGICCAVGDWNSVPDDERVLASGWLPGFDNVLLAAGALRVTQAVELFRQGVEDLDIVELSRAFRDEYDNDSFAPVPDGWADSANKGAGIKNPVGDVVSESVRPSPNGVHIAFLADTGVHGQQELFVATADGSSLYTVSDLYVNHDGSADDLPDSDADGNGQPDAGDDVSSSVWLSDERIVYVAGALNQDDVRLCAVADVDGSNRVYLGAFDYDTGAQGVDRCVPIPAPVPQPLR